MAIYLFSQILRKDPTLKFSSEPQKIYLPSPTLDKIEFLFIISISKCKHKSIWHRTLRTKYLLFKWLFCGGRRSESEPDTETRQEDLENSATSSQYLFMSLFLKFKI